MANQATIAAIFIFLLALSSNFELSVCRIVKGKVSCLDCHDGFNFSGIKILMKCDGERKPATTTTTTADGKFEAELPGSEKPSRNCLAKILGGLEQLYAQKHSMASQIVMSEKEPNTLTTSKSLIFSLSCPKPVGESPAGNLFGSSKTVEGMPPTGNFFPFLPIIGIP